MPRSSVHERGAERPEERLGLLDVRDVAGIVDDMQRPTELRARQLGNAERNHPVPPAPDQGHGDVDASEVSIGDPLRTGLDELPHRPLDVRDRPTR